MDGLRAVVVEGGAMRGVFSAGVLDVFDEQGFRPFDLALGTSAGVCNLASYVSGQQGRNLRCYTQIMCRKELFDWGRWLRGGHYMDLDWLWERFDAEDPLDQQALTRDPMTLIAVSTCADSGEPVYHTLAFPHINVPLKGSSALPLLYRGPVRFQDQALVDGGLTDPFAAREAYRRGARHIVVIRTRPAHVIKGASPMDYVSGWMLRERPALARAARRVAERYAAAIAFLRKPPADCRIVEIAPPRALACSRTTQDPERLRHDYDVGRQAAYGMLDRLAMQLA